MNLDLRIGTLNSGKFYAFANGYDAPEVIGTLAEVETALGIRAAEPAQAAELYPIWIVTLSFQFPAWDERDGIDYEVRAASKGEANDIARHEARRDGHLGVGKGRYTFTARRESGQ